jgi:hypothetical protein
MWRTAPFPLLFFLVQNLRKTLRACCAPFSDFSRMQNSTPKKMLVLAHSLCSRVFFGEKFGAVTKSENDLQQDQRMF